MESLKDYMVKQNARDFMNGIQRQLFDRQYKEETLEAATKSLIKIFKRAESMTNSDADAFLTTCLAVYILASYETKEDVITDIIPDE